MVSQVHVRLLHFLDWNGKKLTLVWALGAEAVPEHGLVRILYRSFSLSYLLFLWQATSKKSKKLFCKIQRRS